MEARCHQHDINDKVWALVEPHLPGQRGVGYCEPGRPGMTCLPITGSGAALIRGSFVGAGAETLLADRGYDTNDILAYAVSGGMEPGIFLKKNGKGQRNYDEYLYKPRHGRKLLFYP